MAGLPALILLPFGGVLADHVDRRQVLIFANLVNSLIALRLAILRWTGAQTAWQLLASSLVRRVIATIAALASQSIIPTAAGEDHIPNAVALNSFQYNVLRAIGPAMVGLALAWCGGGMVLLAKCKRRSNSAASDMVNGRLYNVSSDLHEVGVVWLGQPLVVCDVYEHALYVDYTNRKQEYVNKFVQFIDWEESTRRFTALNG